MIQYILDRKGTEVVTIRDTETVKSAADRMRELGIAALVVKNGDAINGVISEREIVEAVSRQGDGDRNERPAGRVSGGALSHSGNPCAQHARLATARGTRSIESQPSALRTL
jgi:CBS domain-containing protein